MDARNGITDDDQIKITLPTNLLAQIDAQVGSQYSDREDFIRSAVRRQLEYVQESQTRNPSVDVG